MDKQREFWKHNINPITGFPYSFKAESSALWIRNNKYIKLAGWKPYPVVEAEYDIDISSVK